MKKIEFCPSCEGQAFDAREYDAIPESVKGIWPEEHCFSDKSIAVCRDCGLGFTREWMSDDEISEFYRIVYSVPRSPKDVPKISDLNELGLRFLTQVLYLKIHIHLYDGMRILEIGPNEVSALPSLNLFCSPQYSYFDQMEWPIIKSYGGRCLGSYASGEKIVEKFSEGSVDLIYSSHSLEHINPSSLEEMFEAISKVTASGGYLFFEIPDDFKFNGLLRPHTLFFTEDSIRRQLERYNFDVADISRWDGGGRYGVSGSGKAKTVNETPSSTGIITRLRRFGIQAILSNDRIARILKPWRLRRAMPRVLRIMPTPYETTPYYRVLARRRSR